MSTQTYFKNSPKLNNMISARQHCIPAYDELSSIRQVQAMPDHLEEMEEKTARGIIQKLKAVTDSDYFKSLPGTAVIKSGGNNAYQWSKAQAKAEPKESGMSAKIFCSSK